MLRAGRAPMRPTCDVNDQKNMYFEGELVILIIQIRNFDEKLALSGQKDQIDDQNTAFFDQKCPQKISGAKSPQNLLSSILVCRHLRQMLWRGNAVWPRRCSVAWRQGNGCS